MRFFRRISLVLSSRGELGFFSEGSLLAWGLSGSVERALRLGELLRMWVYHPERDARVLGDEIDGLSSGLVRSGQAVTVDNHETDFKEDGARSTRAAAGGRRLISGEAGCPFLRRFSGTGLTSLLPGCRPSEQLRGGGGTFLTALVAREILRCDDGRNYNKLPRPIWAWKLMKKGTTRYLGLSGHYLAIVGGRYLAKSKMWAQPAS